MKPTDIIHVQSYEVACDGGGGTLGHPKVYLHIDHEKGSIVCPYCSRMFVLRMSAIKSVASH